MYSLFGSKDGLLDALALRAFETLGAGIHGLPASEDPAADLVEAGVVVFRRFAVDHPSLFRLVGLHQRVARLGQAGGLGDLAVSEATLEFHALCERLAALELSGLISARNEELIWRHALIAGLNHTPMAPAESPSDT